MLFRSGHHGTLVFPVLIFTFPFSASRRNCGLVSFSLLSLALGTALPSATAAPARNKPFQPVGVEAWTSGSQTFIRARPSAAVPPVAKVGRHTPLHVWGKYNGWYRVETHDHIFGWVFNPYLNSPGLDKVREMPRSKARLASNRTAHQTMYGTPAMLKQHFVTYGAKGALVGLQKQGVYLAVAPKRRTVLAATDTSSKTSSKTEASTAKPRSRLAVAPRRVEPAAPIKMASPVPVIETPRRATGTSRTAAARPAPAEVPNPAAVTVPSVAAPSVAPLVAPSVVAPREVEVGQIVGASRDIVPSARSFARAAGEAASQSAPRAVAPRAVPSVKPPVAASAVAPRPATVAPAPRAVPAKPRVVAKPRAAKAKKPVAKTSRRSRLSASKARKRELLRNQMGLSPAPMPPTVIAPVSPAELLKARQEYLSERKARLNPPVASPGTSSNASPGTPVGNLAPLPPPSGPLGGTPGDSTGTALPPAPPALQPMAWPGQGDRSLSPLYPILAHPTVVALSQIKPQAPQSVAKAASPARTIPERTTPSSAAPAVRGGSPRDRFGSGMASQALSYRGARYIRGAASPGRGFDCSGLVYYLLRQRGYKPPRTAAGYRTWGQSVPRGQWQPGDLVLFANTYKRGVSHIGVYLGQNKFVHAATSGTGVRVSSLSEKYYARKYFGARRAKMTAQ